MLNGALSDLRPLTEAQVASLFPQWRAEDALFVFCSNALEGSSLTLGETILLLEKGVTSAGKPLADHVDAANGQDAYSLMLDFAQQREEVTLETIFALHSAIVGGGPLAGRLRNAPIRILASSHIPPPSSKVPGLVDRMLASYHHTKENAIHPVIFAARLYLDLLTIHPFFHGNGPTARLLQNLVLIRESYAPILIEPSEQGRYRHILRYAQAPGGLPENFITYMARMEGSGLKRYSERLREHGSL